MINRTFDEFKVRHPEFIESWRSYYFKTMICSKPPVIQHGFLVDSVSDALSIINIKQPISILCGSMDLLDSLTIQLSESLLPLVRLHNMNKDQIYIIFDSVTLA